MDRARQFINAFPGGPPELVAFDPFARPTLRQCDDFNQLKLGIELPVCQLLEGTNVEGYEAYGGDIERCIRFSLADDDSKKLRDMCNAVLRDSFYNCNNKKLQHFVNDAFTEGGDMDAGWSMFACRAKPPWERNGTYTIKARSRKGKQKFIMTRSAEMVDHTGRLNVKPGARVKLTVMALVWAFNGSYGLTLKLDNAGMVVLNAGLGIVPRKTFVSGNAYLCVGQDDELQLRDASGYAFTVELTPKVMRHREVLITAEQAQMFRSLETKCGAPFSMVKDDADGIWLSILPKVGHSDVSSSSTIRLRAVPKKEKSMMTVTWQLD